jgi:hypothetical protein
MEGFPHPSIVRLSSIVGEGLIPSRAWESRVQIPGGSRSATWSRLLKPESNLED